jgi:hypothetical protein
MLSVLLMPSLVRLVICPSKRLSWVGVTQVPGIRHGLMLFSIAEGSMEVRDGVNKAMGSAMRAIEVSLEENMVANLGRQKY